MADNIPATLLSKMASLPQTHAELLRSQAVSQLIGTLHRGDAAAQDAAVRGLATLARSPRANGSASPPQSPLKVSLTID